MSVDIYEPSPEDALSLDELDLYRSINDYRAQNGLPAVPLSRALTVVAGRHALDLVENIGDFVAGAPGENRGHSWSDAPYDGRDAATYSNMWTAPQRLQTGYPGDGYEIAIGYPAPYITSQIMTPAQALSGWEGSALHNAVILNQPPWNRPDLSWDAVGVGIYKGVATVWFGADPDPTGPTPIVGTNGNDSITGLSSPNIIDGGPGDDTVVGGPGADTIRGLDNNDCIFGANGGDDLNGNLGDDTVYGGQGADLVRGGQGNDMVFGDDGDDSHVNGNIGNDTVHGGVGDDTVFGGQGDDQVFGDDGNDYLSGDLGSDTLTGGPGADTFHLGFKSGHDYVTDFKASEGDKVVLDHGASDIVTQSGSDTLITLSTGEQLTLQGVNSTTLPAGWIVVT
jgi:Ca2+-binding RTX toxin-like protein